MNAEEVQQLIKQQNLSPISPIKNGVWKCSDEKGKLFVFKLVDNPSEIKVYQSVLAPISKKIVGFKKLLLPELVKTDGKSWIVMPFYAGVDYNDTWKEFEPGKIGGKALGVDLAEEMAEVIMDLRKINLSEIEENQVFKEIPTPKFDYAEWLKLFERRASQIQSYNLVSEDEIKKAKAILGDGLVHSKMVFSCGDYYPRNIIKTNDDRIVLIDWQGWGSDYRVNFIDYEENLIAFAYIHMWNNYLWQWTFLNSMQKQLKIDPHNFQKSLIIKSFDQACLWAPISDKVENNVQLIQLFRSQMQIFSNALDFQYIQNLLKFTKPSRWGFIFNKFR